MGICRRRRYRSSEEVDSEGRCLGCPYPDQADLTVTRLITLVH